MPTTKNCFEKGLIHHQSGELKKAISIYEEVLHSNPTHANALHSMGVALAQQGEMEKAVGWLSKALQVAPKNAYFHNSLANVFQEMGLIEKALHHYRLATDFNQKYTDAYINQAKALAKQGNHQAVVDCYNRALALQPTADIFNQRGMALHIMGNYDAAITSFQSALALNEAQGHVHNNLGIAFAMLKRFSEAIAEFNRALEISPDLAEAYKNLANVQRERRQFGLAIDNYKKYLAIKPGDADLYVALGLSYRGMDDFGACIQYYKKALQIDPEQNFILGGIIHNKTHICLWDGFQESLDRLNMEVRSRRKSTSPFAYLAMVDSPSLHKIAAATLATDSVKRVPPLPEIPRRSRSEKIRIGYYSADFHNHATAYLMAELFELHDRSKFELIGFSFGPHSTDAMRQRLVRAFDQFHDIRLLSNLEIAQKSRKLGVDIAVDLKGFTLDARPEIFMARCAPIQVNYLGYPGTMAVECMDYLIADQVLIPEESRHHYTEKIVYLPDSYQVNDRQRQIADKRWTRTDLGLPEQGFVFCCFNNNYKILPATFDIWMRLLQQVPNSVLWLFEANTTASQNLRQEAERRGVAPKRLVFAKHAPLPEHLARYPLADLFLDTFPYNAHTTASDALWAGLPVLTQMGQSFAARVAASLLSAIGLPELITDTPQAYEARALELAMDPAQLQALKAKLRANRLTTPLFDTPRFARHLENAYQQMVERYWSGLAPDHLAVAAVPMEVPAVLPVQQPSKTLRNVGLAEIVQHLRAVLDTQGLEAALAFTNHIRSDDGEHIPRQALILGELASQLLRIEPATAQALLNRAKELAPDSVTAHHLSLAHYFNSGQGGKALESARFILAAPDASPVQILDAARILSFSACDANAALKGALKAFEQLHKPLGFVSNVLEVAQSATCWDVMDEMIQQLQQAHADGRFQETGEHPRTHVLWCANEAHNLEITRIWNENNLHWPENPLPPATVSPLTGRRLRVGYLSGDFRNHPTSYLVNGLLRNHDPAVVELFAYCSGWDDGSEKRREVLSHFSQVHSVQGMTDEDAARLIRSHSIDVLVELNGPTRANRMGILAYRPALVQIDYLGYPGSVGGRVVDYVVGDSYTVPPGAEKAYPEKVIRLDATYQVNDYSAQPPLPPVTRASQSLPEGVPVIGMFNAMNKVRKEVWEVWMHILREVPDAVLWLLDPGKHAYKALETMAKTHGISQARRICIAPKVSLQDHLARIQCADLMLDPWPYGGHTTTSDALFAGVPVLALEGTNFAGRVSGGLLNAAGLGCLVQPTTDAYAATAVHLLRDRRDKLANLQRFVREKVPYTNVFSAHNKAQQLEAAYRITVERAIQGLPPIHLTMKMDLK